MTFWKLKARYFPYLVYLIRTFLKLISIAIFFAAFFLTSLNGFAQDEKPMPEQSKKTLEEQLLEKQIKIIKEVTDIKLDGHHSN